jgi:RimJ/RimL family protein N-acetyltransferase
VSVAIRAAVPADARAIAEVHVAAWRWAYRGEMSSAFLAGLSVDEREADWRRWIGSFEPGTGALVAEDDGRIVGFCSFGPSRDDDATPTRGEVLTLYLLEASAGTGVGRALFTRANDRLRALGYERAVLWVMASNTRSRRFYERAGWAWDGTTSAHRFDCEHLPIVRYVVEL